MARDRNNHRSPICWQGATRCDVSSRNILKRRVDIRNGSGEFCYVQVNDEEKEMIQNSTTQKAEDFGTFDSFQGMGL